MANQDTDRPAGMPGTTPEGSGRNPREYGAGVSVAAMSWDHFRSETMQLMDAVVDRETMTEALRRVERNQGAAGSQEELIPRRLRAPTQANGITYKQVAKIAIK